MARTKHRKGHKEASARRSAYNRLMHRIENAGQPVEVGKNRFKVLPDFEEDVTITVDGQTVPALIMNDGTIRLESGPNKGDLLHVDYRPIEEWVMAQMLGPENFIIRGRGAGKTRELKNFIAQAEAAGRAVLRADVLKQELRELHGLDPQQDGETVYVSVPKRQLQDVVDTTTTTQRFYSMGCDFGDPKGGSTVVIESVPLQGRRAGMSASEHLGKQEMGRMLRNFRMSTDTCSICGKPWPCLQHLSGHLEPAFQLDADGKPCGIQEISICPGPDPNGLTTINPEEQP